MSQLEEIQNKFDRLARNGITISICYGPGPDQGFYWSVNVLTQEYQEFHRPFAANSLEHCLDIAIKECLERGWLKEKS